MSATHQLERTTAQGLCWLASRMLPVEARERYIDEWRSDVAAADEGVLRYAASVLAHSIVLRQALGASEAPRPVLCRIGLHAARELRDHPEDPELVSRRCRRCGQARDRWLEFETGIGEGVAWGAFSQGIH